MTCELRYHRDCRTSGLWAAASRVKTLSAILSPGGLVSAQSHHQVRADILQFFFNAIRAECAFVRTDAGCRRIWRQILVAILAIRSKLQSHTPLYHGRKQYIAGESSLANNDVEHVITAQIDGGLGRQLDFSSNRCSGRTRRTTKGRRARKTRRTRVSTAADKAAFEHGFQTRDGGLDFWLR